MCPRPLQHAGQTILTMNFRYRSLNVLRLATLPMGWRDQQPRNTIGYIRSTQGNSWLVQSREHLKVVPSDTGTETESVNKLPAQQAPVYTFP